ncbi:UspA domain protein [Ammonifex degensii KC4]|uniref:UspA domain protein n=1 Tax=Ammonifex degensii (strain DSM 10501 / KC4) TaxID=429009 RepID=C9R8Q1_AMMDK|nr:universal stress protein [Ammonifex degensii]ACX52680.1 UspA domain protein [Ammonifex degensii KC4]
MRKILVPVDGSENSLRALREGIKLARISGQAKLTILTVVPPVDPTFEYGPWLTREQVEEAEKKAAEKILDQAEKVVQEEGYQADRVVLVGDAGQEIADYAAKEGYDLIVMGSRGMSPLKGIFLGSVSTKVIALAPCPVVIVK